MSSVHLLRQVDEELSKVRQQLLKFVSREELLERDNADLRATVEKLEQAVIDAEAAFKGRGFIALSLSVAPLHLATLRRARLAAPLAKFGAGIRRLSWNPTGPRAHTQMKKPASSAE